MKTEPEDFYDELAGHYHLLFEDWDRSVERQARTLDRLMTPEGSPRGKVLDCACGIGTQLLGLAALGHQVVGSDLSEAAVTRARQEATQRNLPVQVYVADMRTLAGVSQTEFDWAICCDNALPHLTAEELEPALLAIRSKIKPGGGFLASIRDYDAILPAKPGAQEPAFFGEPGSERIVHQVWDWTGERSYTLHLFLSEQAGDRWTTQHFISSYRCLLREELTGALERAGFAEIRWLMPAQSGFYQPIVTARAS